MQLTCPDLSEPQTPRGAATAIVQTSQRSALTPDHPETVSPPFQPLDPAILNAAIPAFFIGRNKEGFWLARDAKGQTGGIFLLKGSALAFARRNSWPSGCAPIFPSERFELDVENQGNPFATYLRPLIRFAGHGRRRTAALISKLAEVFEHRLKVF